VVPEPSRPVGTTANWVTAGPGSSSGGCRSR